MDVISGTIISCKISHSGCWYSIMSAKEKKTFFTRDRIFSLFESCEVALVNKNCSYFLYDYQNSYDEAPLKKNPRNILAASWFSALAESLHHLDGTETEFINRCSEHLSSGNVDMGKLNDIEKLYLKISGFGDNSESASLFAEFFPEKMRLRSSLVNQIKRGD